MTNSNRDYYKSLGSAIVDAGWKHVFLTDEVGNPFSPANPLDVTVTGTITAVTSDAVTTGTVENVTIALANIEQSHTFPANTKGFLIQTRGLGRLKLSFTSGASGTTYYTIWAGAYYSQNNINAASTTIYFQSPLAGSIVELVSWI